MHTVTKKQVFDDISETYNTITIIYDFAGSINVKYSGKWLGISASGIHVYQGTARDKSTRTVRRHMSSPSTTWGPQRHSNRDKH